MKISFLFLFCIQFLSFESNPLTRNEALSNHFSEDKTDDIGYEMYHKLDEAAQKALDLAEEAKSFAEEAGKLQVKVTIYNISIYNYELMNLSLNILNNCNQSLG